MKKSLVILLAIFLSLGFFTACEEEEEPAQQLSAFVIGEWQSQSVDINNNGDDYVAFLVDIEEDHYTLSLVPLLEGGIPDYENEVELPDAGYTVDNDASTITIDQPTFPGEEPSDDVVSFKVTWMEGGDTMTWLPVDPLEDDTPTLIWTRQTGI